LACKLKSTPQLVKFPKKVRIASIDAGENHSLAITVDRELYTWGFNGEGATGHTANSSTPFTEDIPIPTALPLEVSDRTKQYHCYPVQASGGAQLTLVLAQPVLKN
jgi:alpha-tubulin suppressor-like RCC1 family protein